MRHLLKGDRLVIATHNPGKLREIAPLFTPYGIDTVSAGMLGLPEPDETAPDFVGNARIKAQAAAKAAGLPALADDSGFCVAALQGAPGVHSARWAGPEKNFTAAMARVLDGTPAHERRAWFICALCLAWPDGETASFLGRVDGHVAAAPQGNLGFGYDPIFIPLGSEQTYAEVTPEEKERDSHRTRAFAQLQASCLPVASSAR